jgi:hypothetical protein
MRPPIGESATIGTDRAAKGYPDLAARPAASLREKHGHGEQGAVEREVAEADRSSRGCEGPDAEQARLQHRVGMSELVAHEDDKHKSDGKAGGSNPGGHIARVQQLRTSTQEHRQGHCSRHVEAPSPKAAEGGRNRAKGEQQRQTHPGQVHEKDRAPAAERDGTPPSGGPPAAARAIADPSRPKAAPRRSSGRDSRTTASAFGDARAPAGRCRLRRWAGTR